MRYGAAICVGIRRSLAKAPRLVDHEIEPFTVDEVQLPLKTAMDRRNGVRWAIALALGLRQVEARPQVVRCRLGGGSLAVRQARLRPRRRESGRRGLWPRDRWSIPVACRSTCGSIGGFCRRPVFVMHVCTALGMPRGDRAADSRSSGAWCDGVVAQRMAGWYQHVTSAIQRDIASRVDGLIWQVRDDIEQK